MKVGTVCYATDSGLGILAKAFFDNGVVTDPVVVRHGRHPTHDEWYSGAYQVTDLRSPNQLGLAFNRLAECDAVLFFETPFHWPWVDALKARGVRTYLMTMYECTPEKLPAVPDAFLCPSLLDYEVFKAKQLTGRLAAAVLRTPVPVDVPWKKRTRAEVFVHNAGHGGLKGRNGTAELLAAIPSVKSPATFLIRSQKDAGQIPGDVAALFSDTRVTFQFGTAPAGRLYADGDVFVFPEKFNGLSLPLQEAFGSGMLVMATDRFPNNTYLPRGPLVPVASTRRTRIGPPYLEFEEAVIDPKALAAKIDEWYGHDISGLSEQGRVWAGENSWEKLGPKYLEVLSR